LIYYTEFVVKEGTTLRMIDKTVQEA